MILCFHSRLKPYVEDVLAKKTSSAGKVKKISRKQQKAKFNEDKERAGEAVVEQSDTKKKSDSADGAELRQCELSLLLSAFPFILERLKKEQEKEVPPSNILSSFLCASFWFIPITRPFSSL